MHVKRFVALLIFTVLCLSLTAVPVAYAADTEVLVPQGAVKPDTWVAVDGLGRTVSTYEDVGGKREDKIVGCFYWIWFELWKNYEPRNITQIINKNPEAANDPNHPAWEDASVFWWNEPLFGYYQNTDRFVLRKHAEMLADAGIDVIIFDCTNGTHVFRESYHILLKVFEQAKAEGVDVPQFMFMSNFDENEDSITQMKNWYKDIYAKGKYKDL